VLKPTNIDTAFANIDQPWTPIIAGQINDFHLKLAKFEGEFVWHSHAQEDELFLVTKGRLRIELRDQPALELDAGDFAIVPAGVEHRPVAEAECEVILLEPASTVNTGGTPSELTKIDLERIDTQ
jgi:mannose-6-phosphate isomerase-like protein (cupin superfamily)